MNYTVVAIDDHHEICDLLRIALRHTNLEVLTARDGFDGLALVRETQPDVVILDLMMPGMNGWQVYDVIRSDEALAHTPIIVITVLSETAERRRTFAQSEIDLYLTKPFDTVALRRAIERMLGGVQLWSPPGPDIAGLFEPLDS